MKNTSRRRTVPAGKPLKQDHHRADQDLILFQELQRREKERTIVTLLQPVSEEFEPHGNHQLYRIASAKKGSGFEFLAEKEKNDYDWLKTPPATPLFPSSEMDTNSPEIIIQRELPILQSLSRFAAVTNCKAPDTADKKSSDIPKKLRPVTPSTQRRISTVVTNSKNKAIVTKAAPITRTDLKQQEKTSKMVVVDHGRMKTKPTTTSSTATEQRSVSAIRDRSAYETSQRQRAAGNAEPKRPQSSSSSNGISRGTKVVSNSVGGNVKLDFKNGNIDEGDLVNARSLKGKSSNLTGNGGNVLGSKMVQRVICARSKATNQSPLINGTSGFGRTIIKHSMDTTRS